VFRSCATLSIVRTAPLLSFAAALKLMAWVTHFDSSIGGRDPSVHVGTCVPIYGIYTIRGSLWDGEGLSRSHESK
jgi:hypothetical protein